MLIFKYTISVFKRSGLLRGYSPLAMTCCIKVLFLRYVPRYVLCNICCMVQRLAMTCCRKFLLDGMSLTMTRCIKVLFCGMFHDTSFALTCCIKVPHSNVRTYQSDCFAVITSRRRGYRNDSRMDAKMTVEWIFEMTM